MSEAPSELKYSKSHEWVRVNEDGTLTVGITDHAQELLGDLVYVEVPDQGSELEAEQACAVVESVKAASDVYAPVAGTVVEVNEGLTDAPEAVNRDAYGDGWIMRLQPADGGAVNELMDAGEYQQFIESE
jgi:glycine cleavage system H protein